MTNTKVKLKMPILALLIALTSYLVTGVPAGINPALASIAAAFPEEPMTRIYLLTTLVSLVSVPASLSVGLFVKKIGLKWTYLVSLVIVILGGGVLPVMLSSNYNAILVSRVILGIGYGLAFPLTATVVTALFQDASQRSLVLGWGSIVQNLASILFGTGASILLEINVRYVWLINLIVIIPLVLGIFMKNDVSIAASDTVGEEAVAEETDGNTKLPAIILGFILLSCMACFTTNGLILNVSSIMMEEGLSSMGSAMAVNCYSIGGFVVGFIFFKLYKKERIYPLALLACAVSLVAFAILCIPNSIMVIYIGAALIGFAHIMIVTTVPMVVSEYAPKSKIAFANGLHMGLMNLFGFLAGYLFTWMSIPFGQQGNLRFPLYFATVFYIVMCVVFALKSIRTEKKR